MPQISVIIPVLNEAQSIAATIAYARQLGESVEVIVVDGGSDDATLEQAAGADLCLSADCGRARQMNAGAQQATAEWLIFVHADTRPPSSVLEAVTLAAEQQRVWGFFRLDLGDRHPLIRTVAAFASGRSRLFGIATGDQCIFVRRAIFEAVGGFEAIPLMEDIALCKRLRRYSRPLASSAYSVSDSRRWRAYGVVRTIVLMWWLRLQYFMGVSPQKLHQQYYQ